MYKAYIIWLGEIAHLIDRNLSENYIAIVHIFTSLNPHTEIVKTIFILMSGILLSSISGAGSITGWV